MHSSSNLKTPPSTLLTISSIPIKPNPQFCHKNPIFFTSLKDPSSFLTISSTPTNPKPQISSKNPIFFTSLKFSVYGGCSNSSSKSLKWGARRIGCTQILTMSRDVREVVSKRSSKTRGLEKNTSSLLTISSIPTKPNPQICHKNPIVFTSMKFSANGRYSNSRTTKLGLFSASCLIMEEAPLEKLSVVDKVQSLALEFRSLPEPIDRVKRLLYYASILPPLSDSAKVKENRVLGCTTQVWLEVKMDKRGSMRFRVDSDSEITKGFCSCLIWCLDGAEPEEILSVTAEDFADMNVGLPRKGRSRVNTWHNVLFSMQNRTHACVQERERAQSLENLHSLVVVRPHGSYLESEPKCSFEVK